MPNQFEFAVSIMNSTFVIWAEPYFVFMKWLGNKLDTFVLWIIDGRFARYIMSTWRRSPSHFMMWIMHRCDVGGLMKSGMAWRNFEVKTLTGQKSTTKRRMGKKVAEKCLMVKNFERTLHWMENVEERTSGESNKCQTGHNVERETKTNGNNVRSYQHRMGHNVGWQIKMKGDMYCQ